MSGKEKYLLLDSWNKLLANGVSTGAAGADMLQIQVLDDRIDAVADHEIVQVVGTGQDNRVIKCRLVRSRDDIVLLERMEVVDSVQRENLRIPVQFESYLYPTGKNRMPIRSVDLSCGGIACYGDSGMQVGETAEVVIPITEQPLIVRAKILRVNNLNNGKALYAAKFIDLCYDEEKMIRHAVFGIQIRNDRG